MKVEMHDIGDWKSSIDEAEDAKALFDIAHALLGLLAKNQIEYHMLVEDLACRDTKTKAGLCDCDDHQKANGHAESCMFAVPRI
jgi:hypothetical protein